MRGLLLIFIFLTLSGCLGQNAKPFDVKNLAKSDIDMVTDVNIREWNRLAKELTIKLYKRNPKELQKVSGMTLDKRLAQLFPEKRSAIGFAELENKNGVDAAPLAFSETYQGDRVFALMVGITGMLNASYGGKQEIFLLDEVDHQKLYNSARNLESLAWQLNNRKDSNGQLFLLSNGITADGITNYSYERILSKLIAMQDIMATIISDQSNRTINRVVHGAASMTLIPI